MNVLGIHDGHNASAVLFRDGRILASVQEERPLGVKNAMGMPRRAIQDVLAQTGLSPSDIDWVALAGLNHTEYLDIDPSVKPSDLVLQWHQAGYDQQFPTPLEAVKRMVPNQLTNLAHKWLKGGKAREQRQEVLAAMGFDRKCMRMVEHHTAHAATAYYGWGKLDEPILVLTNDGMGDGICATVSIGQNGQLERLASVPYPESVGEIYALTTFLLGMVPLEHEYKLMGMAPYAAPYRAEKVHAELADLVRFEHGGGLRWQRKRGVPPFASAHHVLEKIYRRQRFDYICGGLQRFTEAFLCQWVGNAIAETGLRRVALAGGIFMNVKANKLLLEMAEVEDLFVFPSCGDETLAIGAAYSVYAEMRRLEQKPVDIEPLSDIYWGKSFSDEEIEQAISAYAFSHQVKVETPSDVEWRVAELLANGHVVARFKDRMEFGARALGNRSILANPADPRVVKTINEMIKQRDFWMPFAPSVTVERISDYMFKPKDVPAPYMVFCFDSFPEKVPMFAAGVHPYDQTARPQEVTAQHNPHYHRLIQYYGEMTGEEIILNTSFNLHGFPVVYTPQQALETLDHSGLQTLAIGSFLVRKQ